MNPKPGIWTTEHFAAIVSQVLTMLALCGFISQNDTQTLEEAVTKGIAAVFIFIANAAVVVHYIKSRLHLKSGAQANGNGQNGDKDSQVPKLINSGLILLAVLTVFAGPVQAQYVLPFRNQHEQRLKALEQKIANPQQAAPAPQAPAPQIIYHPYPVQPPLQAFPIQGQPLQTFPIHGQPLQGFPIQGQPLQTLPIPGQPQQALPVPGQPKQAFPIAPPTTPQAPAQPSPAPAPAPQGAPQQSFPVAPPTPSQPPPVGPPAPIAPAPNTGPIPYTTRLVHALYRP
jgi:hypothetical protein